MKLALLMAGQGAQYAGMGESLYHSSPAARRLLDQLEAARPGLLDMCFKAPLDVLSDTRNTQPCVYAVDLAAAAAAAERGAVIEGVAGFSVGEFPAAAFAGVLSPEQGLELIGLRAGWMHDAAQGAEGGMAAVLKLDAEAIRDALAPIGDVWAVNLNCPGQTVISGRLAALDEAKAKLTALGARVMPLPVSGAFHTPLMAEVADKLRGKLSGMALGDPQIPLYANINALPYRPGEMPELLSLQAMSPVLFEQTLRNMAADGFDTFVEAGPGKALAGFVKRTLPEARVISVMDEAGLVALPKLTGGI